MATHPYFGSDGSQMGQVRGLDIADFPQFVKELLGHPAPLNVTREQFHALDKAGRNAAKRVPYFTPAAFNFSPCPRATTRASHCNLIAIDIDDENPAMASVYLRTPAAAGEALRPFAFAMYATASSTFDNPRIRIVVSAEQIPLDRYAGAVDTVAKLLGLTAVTAESFVPVQPMYLPTAFAGDDALGDHPLLAAVPEGKAFAISDIGEPDQVQVSTRVTHAKSLKSGEMSLEDLDFLATTLPEVTLADMESALSAIDPDVPYMEWLEVAAALRHQFPKEIDAAYELFDKWSSKGKKYGGEKDTVAKWISLRPTPRGRRPVTARTLLFRATQLGWGESEAVSQRLYFTLKGWLEHPERSSQSLMKEAVRRIAGSPLLSPLERATLVSILQERLKQAGLKVSSQDLKKEMRRISAMAFPSDEDVKSVPDAQLPPWARGLCYVAATNEFYNRVSTGRYDPIALCSMFNVQLMAPGSEAGRPPIQASDYLLNVVRIPRVDQYVYDPSHPEHTFITEGSTRYLNTYRPTYPEPQYEGAEEVGKQMAGHLSVLLAEPTHEQLLLDWMAYHVQCPGEKVRWAPLIQGAPGCGKTILAKILAVALGAANVRIIEGHVLFDKYTDWATGAQLVVLEEVRVHGHNRHEVMNKLKPAISNDDVTVREMYAGARQERNKTNYLILTNHTDALAVSDSERRYMVMQSPLQTRAQVLALPKDYFVRLFDLIENKPGEIRAWLMSHKISPEFQPHAHAPKTKFLDEMAVASESPIAAQVREYLDTPIHALISKDLLSARVVRDLLWNDGFRDARPQTIACILREKSYRVIGKIKLPDGYHSIWVLRGSQAEVDPSMAIQKMIDNNKGVILQPEGALELAQT